MGSPLLRPIAETTRSTLQPLDYRTTLDLGPFSPAMLRPSLAAAVQWSSQTASRPTSEGMVGRVYSSGGKGPVGGRDMLKRHFKTLCKTVDC